MNNEIRLPDEVHIDTTFGNIGIKVTNGHHVDLEMSFDHEDVINLGSVAGSVIETAFRVFVGFFEFLFGKDKSDGNK